MHQAAVLEGSALDALALQQDGLAPAEIDISRDQVVQAFLVALEIIVLDECPDTGVKRAWQVVIFQQDLLRAEVFAELERWLQRLGLASGREPPTNPDRFRGVCGTGA